MTRQKAQNSETQNLITSGSQGVTRGVFVSPYPQGGTYQPKEADMQRLNQQDPLFFLNQPSPYLQRLQPLFDGGGQEDPPETPDKSKELPTDLKAFKPTDEQVQAAVQKLLSDKRYTPRELKMIIAKHGGKDNDPMAALDGYLGETNDVFQRFAQREARDQIVIEEANRIIASLQAKLAESEKGRQKVQGDYDSLTTKQKAALVDGLIKDKSSDPVLMKALLQSSYGYSFDVQGEGEEAKLMLVKDKKSTTFDEVVNKDFFAKHPLLAPKPVDSKLRSQKTTDTRSSSNAKPGLRAYERFTGKKAPDIG